MQNVSEENAVQYFAVSPPYVYNIPLNFGFVPAPGKVDEPNVSIQISITWIAVIDSRDKELVPGTKSYLIKLGHNKDYIYSAMTNRLQYVGVPEQSSVQCAAVRAHLSLSKVPPQNCASPNDSIVSATCQGASPWSASCPFTILDKLKFPRPPPVHGLQAAITESHVVLSHLNWCL